MTDQHEDTVPEYVAPAATYTDANGIRNPALIEHGTMPQRIALAEALAKAQAAFPTIPKKSNGAVAGKDNRGNFELRPFKYANLATILECCRAALGANGLSITFPWGADDGLVYVSATLSHASGASRVSLVNWPVLDNIQRVGALRTYLARYAVAGLLGVDSEEDIDEAPAGTPEPEKPKPEPTKPQQRRQQPKAEPKPEPKPEPKAEPERPRSEPPPAVVETVATELPEAPAELPATERGPARTDAQAGALAELSKALSLNSQQLAQILREHTGHALTALREPGGEKLANVLLGILKAKYEESQDA